MELPYKDCIKCVATPFCQKYRAGKPPVSDTRDWCAEQGRLNRALELSQIPLEYLDANIYNYKLDFQSQKSYEKIKPIVDNIVEEIDKGVSVLITGSNCGVGKTFNAAVILNHFIYKTCLTSRFDYENPIAMYVDYAQLMCDLRNFDDNEDAQFLFEQIKTVPLLLIDDIGAGIMSRFTREQTYLLLNYRFNNRLSTIATSNYSIKELKEDDVLGARNVSRLSRNYVFIAMHGDDRRQVKNG